jgi:hypothetical protein
MSTSIAPGAAAGLGAASGGEQAAVASASRPGLARGSVPRPDKHVIVGSGRPAIWPIASLLPGPFHLAAAVLMPDRYRIIGSSRRGLTPDRFRRFCGVGCRPASR